MTNFIMLMQRTIKNNPFLTFMADFPIESLWGSSLLLALLYFSFQLTYLVSLRDKKEAALKWTSWMSWIAISLIPITLLVRLTAENHLYTFSNSFLISNNYIIFLQMMVMLSTSFVLTHSKEVLRQHPHHLMEYPFLISLSSWFLTILLAANHFLVLMMGLVGFSIMLYVILMVFSSDSSSHKNENLFTTHEASVKYFYLSAFSTALILMSMVILYTATGTLDFPGMQLFFSQPGIFNEMSAWQNLIALSLTCYIMGFAFKLSSYPAHVWAPDVYQGTVPPVMAFLVMPVKIATFGIFTSTLASTLNFFADYWNTMLLLLAMGSLVLGAAGAVLETRFKRFIAYSSINQMGFILMGLVLDNLNGYQSSIAFLIMYIITNMALFSVFLSLTARNPQKPMIFMTDLNDMDSSRWIEKITLSCVFLSLAGVPPFAGFWGKLFIFLSSIKSGHWFMAMIGIMTSMMSAFYYMRLVKNLWFEEQESKESSAITFRWSEYSKPGTYLSKRLKKINPLWPFPAGQFGAPRPYPAGSFPLPRPFGPSSYLNLPEYMRENSPRSISEYGYRRWWPFNLSIEDLKAPPSLYGSLLFLMFFPLIDEYFLDFSYQLALTCTYTNMPI